MILMPHRLGERYSPLYFLAALGAGGLTANFFIWLLFWVPHPGQPVPVFEDLMAAWATGILPLRTAIGIATGGIVVFALLHLRLLWWNLIEYSRWRYTGSAQAMRAGNAETQLLALPLTIAMTINVFFILGMVCVPGLWSVVEYLFPAALMAFFLVGVWALRLLGDFYGRVLTEGGFDCNRNNSFAQLLPSFALAMVGVGLAAPAAMSTTPWIAGLSYLLADFFIVAAFLLGIVMLAMGMRAMMVTGASAETAPTLWLGVPILTVLTIALLRRGHGAHVHFGAHTLPIDNLSLITGLVSAQLAFLFLGWVVLSRNDYFRRYVFGTEVSPGSWTLICPGVALGVMLHFFTNAGLVPVGLVAKFGVAYWVLTGLALAIQAATMLLVLRLGWSHFGRERAAEAVTGMSVISPSSAENRAALAAAAPDLPDRLLALIARDGIRLSVGDGQPLFSPGDVCRGFLLVLKGHLRVVHAEPGERSAVLYRVGPGESCIVTTACLMAAEKYQAWGLAEGEVDALVLSADVFRRLMAESEAFRCMALGPFATRVNKLVDVIEELMLRRIEPRQPA
jgi:CRP-like cAMP-binding protein